MATVKGNTATNLVLRSSPGKSERCKMALQDLVLLAQPQATSVTNRSPIPLARHGRLPQLIGAPRLKVMHASMAPPTHYFFYKACCSLNSPVVPAFPMPTAILPPPSHISLRGLYQLLQPVTVDRSSSAAVFENCGRTFRCTPSSIFRPETEYQIQLILELARRERKTVRAVGVGHSPSDLACTAGYMIQMNRLDKIIEVRYHRTYLIYSVAPVGPVRLFSLEPRGFSPLFQFQARIY